MIPELARRGHGDREAPSQTQQIMTGSTIPAATPRPDGRTDETMTGWLSCNRLDPARCNALLDRIDRPPALPHASSAHHGTLPADADTALHLAAAAFGAAFPDLASMAADTCGAAAWHLIPAPEKPEPAFTLDRGPAMPPLVSLHCRGRAADLLALAHEFGHAVQIMATNRAVTGPMPPLARELCAFLSELALIEWLEAQGDPAMHQVISAHLADDAIYFGRDAAVLHEALGDPGRPYDHRWNYPPARWLAPRMFADTDRSRLAALYVSGADAPAHLTAYLPPLLHDREVKP